MIIRTRASFPNSRRRVNRTSSCGPRVYDIGERCGKDIPAFDLLIPCLKSSSHFHQSTTSYQLLHQIFSSVHFAVILKMTG